MKPFWTRSSAKDDDATKLSDEAREAAKALDAPEPEPAHDVPSAEVDPEQLRANVIAALRTIFDPEVPVNIYDLGLIYAVDVTDEGDVAITMTLTTPHCPVAESMPGEVEMRCCAVPGVRDAEVNLVWDPPWGPNLMSDEARLELGML